jgi:hypothetical protein
MQPTRAHPDRGVPRPGGLLGREEPGPASAGVDLEFSKNFKHYRFDPKGTWVADRLWTEGSIET